MERYLLRLPKTYSQPTMLRVHRVGSQHQPAVDDLRQQPHQKRGSPRDKSRVCDLMEVVRPKVDAWLLNWLQRELLTRSWFFETREGNCRLVGPFAAKLSETTSTWRKFVAPWAEYIA